MGEISKQLHVKLKAMASNVLLPQSSKGRKPSPQTPDIEKMIAEAMDPVHTAYNFVHHITSVFVENVSQLPEMRAFTKEVGKAEDEYLPEGPPMSPLTRSYFTSWAFFDHRIGKTTDTLASCLIDANDIIWMNPDQLHALKEMNESRMGIYEHKGMAGELMCGCENSSPTGSSVCHVASGYRGKAGELWYVRLLPPLVPKFATYHVAFTTPYVLLGSTKKDWIDFLRRNMVGIKASSEAEALHWLLKFGPRMNYWNEFVLLAYHHQANAIYLSGIPDLKSTLPHA